MTHFSKNIKRFPLTDVFSLYLNILIKGSVIRERSLLPLPRGPCCAAILTMTNQHDECDLKEEI